MTTNICITNTLKLINVLQNNSRNLHSCDISCTRPFLGPLISTRFYNTRVITIYSKDGNMISFDYVENNETFSSSFFRIQNIDDKCCSLLLLKFSDGIYSSTGQTVVVNLDCICAIKCIDDVFVSNV